MLRHSAQQHVSTIDPRLNRAGRGLRQHDRFERGRRAAVGRSGIQAGFFCGSQRATPTAPLPYNCAARQFGSNLIQVPGPNAENDDLHPPRIASRNLFDVAVGDDNLFKSDHYRWSLTLTSVNIGNKTALYNFLSTFSGTHCVTPRTLTAELGFHF
jgi:hypothetical protein